MLYWAVGAAEKKIQTAIFNYATFEGSFLCFREQKKVIFLKCSSVRTEKLYTTELRQMAIFA